MDKLLPHKLLAVAPKPTGPEEGNGTRVPWFLCTEISKISIRIPVELNGVSLAETRPSSIHAGYCATTRAFRASNNSRTNEAFSVCACVWSDTFWTRRDCTVQSLDLLGNRLLGSIDIAVHAPARPSGLTPSARGKAGIRLACVAWRSLRPRDDCESAASG